MTFTVELLVLITAYLTVASSAILLPIGQSTIVPKELDPETLSEHAFEGDIVLTQQQRTEAVTRKATPYSVLLWPSDPSGVISVPYTFGDSIINRTGVQKAIAHWQDKTCVTFKAADPNYTGARLIFLNSNQCASYIGRVSDHGQQIWLHPNCVSNIGSTVHEIGHALGFFHEQSRSDRDEFVEIKTENISPETISNFGKYQTKNYEVPYDYHSVMHYGSHFFSMNGKATIVAKQVLAQPLLGNRLWLSFMDIKLANKMYGCSD
ncbi:blastula protease 10-like [Hyalella azteca]|uniref:Metalloendopeptidase n=1 Tax=Hyalella azteca TaxID=294128 RepID=A0A8B7NXI1_HYAAZ|nr:blastula protease 10-like [Hyalella azteca]